MKILNSTQIEKLIFAGHASLQPFQKIHFNGQTPWICSTCELELDIAHNFLTKFSESNRIYMELLTRDVDNDTQTDEIISGQNVAGDDYAQSKCAPPPAKSSIPRTKVKLARIEKKPQSDSQKRKALKSPSAVCRICDKQFSSRSNMLRHRSKHQGKRYVCQYGNCQSDFSQLSSMKYHIKSTHEGLTPHACGVCEKKISLLATMKHHLRTHSGEKPFVCDHCGKGFAVKHNIVRHMRVHRNGRRCLARHERLDKVQVHSIEGEQSK